IRDPFAGDTLGEVEDDVIATVVYGGMYNADAAAAHPFLNEEYRWIGKAMNAGIPLLGICQGAQMIAHHQGAWAGARPSETYEFGYYEVTPTDLGREILPEPLVLAQAHFHTFDLPRGAVHLASSATYENQAFQLGENVFGFQFHAEQTIEGFRRWQVRSPELFNKPGAQSLAEQTELMHHHDAAQAKWFYGFMARFLGVDAA
ncbi:MAG: glutamine amidotransferase, partial [Arenibacterium sp.]